MLPRHLLHGLRQDGTDKVSTRRGSEGKGWNWIRNKVLIGEVLQDGRYSRSILLFPTFAKGGRCGHGNGDHIQIVGQLDNGAFFGQTQTVAAAAAAAAAAPTVRVISSATTSRRRGWPPIRPRVATTVRQKENGLGFCCRWHLPIIFVPLEGILVNGVAVEFGSASKRGCCCESMGDAAFIAVVVVVGVILLLSSIGRQDQKGQKNEAQEKPPLVVSLMMTSPHHYGEE
mmetsp:Transcript_9647/g.26701  ORF Transcript_9647/g.26701 Transcript_9647/m.26701 type:complete len:229 (+) Transcript_9647:3-689(+)